MSRDNNCLKDGRLANVGGEALIEGVMMRGPDSICMAVRAGDGSIKIEKKSSIPLAKKKKILGIPVIRGAIGLFESMTVGMKSLMHSAELVEVEEQEEPGKAEKFLTKIFGEKLQDSLIYISVLIALVFGILLFVAVPNLISGFILNIMGMMRKSVSGSIVYNLIEGVLRIIIFVSYIAMVSKMRDIQRVFEYHGAEHKTIHCYEAGEDLTVENVKKYSTRHPRCGTAFLLVVMIVSILVFSVVGLYSWWVNILLRIILIPLVAGLSYEIIRYGGKSKSKFMNLVNAPGLAMQSFTTREPDGSQMECAIAALKGVIGENVEQYLQSIQVKSIDYPDNNNTDHVKLENTGNEEITKQDIDKTEKESFEEDL